MIEVDNEVSRHIVSDTEIKESVLTAEESRDWQGERSFQCKGWNNWKNFASALNIVIKFADSLKFLSECKIILLEAAFHLGGRYKSKQENFWDLVGENCYPGMSWVLSLANLYRIFLQP